VLVPLALAAGGQWRAFAAAGASAALLVLASFALFGAAAWQGFVASLSAAPAMYESGRILFAGMANPFGAARLMGAGPALAYGLQAAASLGAACVVVAVWQRRLSLPTRAATLASAALVAAPLALLYDLMLGTIAAVWLIRDRNSPAAAPAETIALAVLFLLVLDGRGLAERWHLPAFPFAAIALFAIAGARAWREAAQQRGAASGSVIARCAVTVAAYPIGHGSARDCCVPLANNGSYRGNRISSRSYRRKLSSSKSAVVVSVATAVMPANIQLAVSLRTSCPISKV